MGPWRGAGGRRHGTTAGLRGGLVALAGLAAVCAASAPHWPDRPVLETLARLLETPLPHLVAMAVVLAGLAGLAGARRTGAALALLALAGGGGTLWVRHMPHSAPLAAPSAGDLTVLWANMKWSNATPPAALITALADSPADIVILAEAAALEPHLAALERPFPHQAGCGMPQRCEILVLARSPLAEMTLVPMHRTRPGRMARIRVARPDGPALTLLGAHLLKPWFGDMADYDDALLRAELARHAGPVAVLGDFNAAPWSLRMQRLAASCGLAWPRRPPATWPAAAGPLGVPIDLALVRGGARLTAHAAWGGAALGSDHRGLLVRIAPAAPAAPGATPVPATCRTTPRDIWKRAT